MARIKVMDELLANKIAAGEVVEKCASVVKELVENSIDAGSSEIKVELIEAGTKEIKVTDNGCGMDKDDAVLAFQRHATSKIKNEDDLFHIDTLGFRIDDIKEELAKKINDIKNKKSAVEWNKKYYEDQLAPLLTELKSLQALAGGSTDG